jgi:hypothetical protein
MDGAVFWVGSTGRIKAMGLLLFLVWAFVAVYSIAGLAILTVARLQWAWSLLPSDSEIVTRLERVA